MRVTTLRDAVAREHLGRRDEEVRSGGQAGAVG